MPAVDLSQLPEPAIIAEPDFEAILADTKAMMIAAYPAEQREAVSSAALELESEPLNVIAQTMSFREMLLRQRVNEGARACMLSHSAGTDLDNLAGNMNTKRLVYHSGNGYHRRGDGERHLAETAGAAGVRRPECCWPVRCIRVFLPAAPAVWCVMRGLSVRLRQM